MLLQDKQVAIVGGGPGGLLLGRLLQQAGVRVHVYERDVNQHVRQQGSTLDMHYDTGLRAIATAGLLAEFKQRYRPGADRSAVVDSQLRVLLKNERAGAEEDLGQEFFRPEIDRGPLRDMLVASLRAGVIVWDSRFVQLTAAGEGWQLSFENGTSAYADLVVAADGANSKLRPYLTPIEPVYSGATAIEGSIADAPVHAPHLWQLASNGSLYALENGRTVFFITRGDGTLTFLMGVTKPENWLATSGLDLADRATVAAWFRQEFAGWSADWDELFATEAVRFAPRVWYHFPPDQYWPPQPNLTILGDAAHRIPPYAGEGANQALADALDLYEALCGNEFATVQQAIAAYEQQMLRRSAAITDESLHNTAVLHAPDNQQFLLHMFASNPENGPVRVAE